VELQLYKVEKRHHMSQNLLYKVDTALKK